MGSKHTCRYRNEAGSKRLFQHFNPILGVAISYNLNYQSFPQFYGLLATLVYGQLSQHIVLSNKMAITVAVIEVT